MENYVLRIMIMKRHNMHVYLASSFVDNWLSSRFAGEKFIDAIKSD